MGIIPLLLMAGAISFLLDRLLPDFERPTRKPRKG